MVKMSDLNVDISQLPQDVRDKLAELDLELSEGTEEMGRAFVYIRVGAGGCGNVISLPYPSTPSFVYEFYVCLLFAIIPIKNCISYIIQCCADVFMFGDAYYPVLVRYPHP